MEQRPDSSECPLVATRRLVRSPRRWILAALGVLCVGLGLLGVFVPGLPTTIFLILASYLLTRSCPVLEEKLLGIRFFRPYLPYVRGEQAMPRRARLAALAMMWAAAGGSLALLATRQVLQPWVAAVILGAAAVGTVAVLAWRRTVPVEARDRESSLES